MTGEGTTVAGIPFAPPADRLDKNRYVEDVYDGAR
jgi:hypothetical protein